MLRTAKSCGPDAPTLASSSRRHVGPTGLRQPISADDGGKQARSPGRARRKPLKPLRAGMPGDSGVLVYSCAFYQYQVHTRPRVQRASGIPHALFGRKIQQRLARIAPRGRERVFRRHCDHRAPQPSSPAKAGDPVFRGVNDGVEKSQRTGYSAGACHRAR
jgi:hypothetical protein